jgi:acyl carrier protein
MPDQDAICARLIELFVESLDRDVPSIDTDLFETGVLDSLAFIELLVTLEREFGTTVSVDDLEVDHFRSIRLIAAFVGSRSAERTARVIPLMPKGSRA